ncbi:MAG: tRNA (N6-threonylcarbamoyladenosine(37)-N6)-methyltransferase TrmO [Rhodobacteraceae bacterium]|nr:tRNA (N6-threonylcarbamoyladenosine(37)-N6)-methyltransferase TrmO [Paracoccaceae bacterium]
MTQDLRPSEVALPFSPGTSGFAQLQAIGRLQTPWARGNCPKNLTEARARGGDFRALIDAPFRPGLAGLSVGQAVILLYWTGEARRDLIVQSPAHRDGPAGVFALRSPARPNPVALAVVRLLAMDAQAGTLQLDALDAFDGTALLDIKPWLPGVDIPPAPGS